jgi:putative transposase
MKLDIIVRCDRTGVRLGRPTLTVVFDHYSRMPLGFSLDVDTSGVLALTRALRNAILPKDYVRRIYPDVKGKWPCCRVPENLYLDNGVEFRSKAVEEAALALGISIEFMPAGDLALKGPTERFFGTLARDLIYPLSGTNHGDAERGYHSGKGAVLGLGELTYRLHKWIINDYSHRVHRALGDTPFNVYKAGVACWGVTFPGRVEDLDHLHVGVG